MGFEDPEVKARFRVGRLSFLKTAEDAWSTMVVGLQQSLRLYCGKTAVSGIFICQMPLGVCGWQK